jgi:hypothetical protein
MWRATLLHCWWDCKLVQPLWKSVWQFLRELDIVLLEDPTIPLLGLYPEDVPTGKKDTCSTMFIAALFIIAKSWKREAHLSCKLYASIQGNARAKKLEWVGRGIWGGGYGGLLG